MGTEQIPTTWSAADEAFFRIVARLFPSEFLAGASVLLAGFDVVEDSSDLVRPVARQAAAT